MSDLPSKDLSAKRSLVLIRKHGLKLFSVGASLIALILSLTLHSRSEQALLAAQNSYQQQQSINTEANQANVVLKQYLSHYRVLQEQGIIAHAKRLQWLEAIQANLNENPVPKLAFTLSPTVPASVTNTTYAHETLAVKVTPMHVDFILVHEGDLQGLLANMRNHSQGLFSAQSCDVTRTEEPLEDPQNATQGLVAQDSFKGFCDLLWYSLTDITQVWEGQNAPQ